MATTLQIIGHKKSGKTLITTALIKRLTQVGYRVAAIKHDAHNAAMDVPHTDSARMSGAGAHQVILQSASDFFFHQQGNVPPLSSLVEWLGKDNDFVLIEGHKQAHYPKLVLLKPGEEVNSITSSQPIQTGSIFNTHNANLRGKDAIINWCFTFLEHTKGVKK